MSAFDQPWEGIVVDVNGGRPMVKIPLLSGHQFVHGPCRVAAAAGVVEIEDDVIVEFFGGDRSRPVITDHIAI